jgi:uncharacterized protein (DUF433 family)
MLARQSSLESIVSCSPDVMSGTPVFRGTRVPVKNLLDYLAAGDSLEDFLAQFPTVKREQAAALLAVAEELILARLGEASPR